MSLSRILICIACAACAAAAASAAAADPPAPDRALSQTIACELRERDGNWRLTAHVTLEQTFLTERATADRRLMIHEDPYGVIDELEVRLGGNRLQRVAEVVYPQRRDVFFNESRVWVVTLPPELAAGDRVTVDYDIVFDQAAYLPVLKLPGKDLVERFELRFDHPAGVTVDFDVYYPREPVPVHITRPTAQLTVLRADSLFAVPELPYFDFNDVHAIILTSVRSADGPITPTAIPDFAAWYAELVGPDPEAPAELDPELAATLAAAADDVAKLTVIHDFVRRSVRYVHDAGRGHRFVPAPPAEVLANRYGDCKDRAYLVRNLARREGLDVQMALISTWPHLRFDAGTDVFLFNHVINAYGSGDGLIFFDPTGRHVPFGELPEPVIGREALVLDPADPRQLTVPAPSGAVFLDVRVTAALDALADGSASIVLQGPYYIAASEILAQTRGLDRENALDRLVDEGIRRLDLDGYQVVEEGPATLRLEARADLNDFVVSSPTRAYLPRVPFDAVPLDVLEREADDYPLHLANRQACRLRIELLAPGVVATADTTRIGDGPGGRFTASMTPADSGLVHFAYDLDRRQKVLAGEAKAGFLDFCRTYLGCKRDLFTLERASP